MVRYDAPVYQSRHPELNEYIAGAVKAVGEELMMVIKLHYIHVSLLEH